MKQSTCKHVSCIGDNTWEDVERKSKDACYSCQVIGPNLWLCLYSRCLYVGCGDAHRDHSSAHYEKSRHPLTLNLTSRRIWCYLCEKEVYRKWNKPPLNTADSGPLYVPLPARLAPHLGAHSPGAEPRPAGDPGAAHSDSESDTEDADKRPRGLTGLQNIGNTCYLNSAVQCLSNCPPLTQFFLYCAGYVRADRKPQLARSYQNLVSDLWHKKRLGYIVPSSVVQGIKVVHPMFRGFMQQDTQEFLRCFMDQLHEELKQELVSDDVTEDGRVLEEPPPSTEQTGAADGKATTDTSPSDTDYDTCESERSSDPAGGEEAGRLRPEAPTHRRAVSLGSDVTTAQLNTNANNTGAADCRAEGEVAMETDCDSGVHSPKEMKDCFNQSKQREQDSPRRRVKSASHTAAAPVDVVDVELGEAEDPDQLRRRGAHRSQSVDDATYSRAKKPQTNSPKTDKKGKKHSCRFKSIISDIFDGKILSSVQCSTCERVSCTKETFQDLSLPIPSKDFLHMVRSHHPQQPGTGHKNSCTSVAISQGWMSWIFGWMKSWFWGPTITLQDCLAAFFSSDELKGDNMYSCDKCKKLRNGMKYSEVLALPEILCIHLKRFRHEFMFSSKITSYVQFPVDGLDLSAYLHKDCKDQVTSYDLIGVICHHGTAGGGHYTAYAQNHYNMQWYEYDDQYVTQVDYQQVENSEAYVLFYRKKSEPMEVVRSQAQELAESQEVRDQVTCPGCDVMLLQGSLMTFYISKQWINKFNTFAEPGPITNRDFLCRHGGVHPLNWPTIFNLVHEVKQPLWEFLYNKYGGGPAVNRLYHCTTCLAEIARIEKKRRYELETFLQLNDDFQSEDNPSVIYAISMSWFREWENFVRSRTNEPPGPIDNRNISLMKSGVAFVRVNSDYGQLSDATWRFLFDIYGGGPELVLRDQRPTEPAPPSVTSSGQPVTSAAPVTSPGQHVNTAPLSASPKQSNTGGPPAVTSHRQGVTSPCQASSPDTPAAASADQVGDKIPEPITPREGDLPGGAGAESPSVSFSSAGRAEADSDSRGRSVTRDVQGV